ncbi:MAG: lipopolysaccharide assembly protein LapB [Gammaproteobacteria bacterium]
MWELSLLLLPVAAFSGWFAARRHQTKLRRRSNSRLPTSYLARLNQLLLEHKADKAVDAFLRLSDIDKDTIETHFALASLFRRQGEVDRAIRIHQYLIEHSNLSNEQRHYSLFQLAYDYLHAGLLDRAESLFLELVNQRGYREKSLRKLMEIYEQQRDWEQAIKIAEGLADESHQSMAMQIAHYYCELGEKARDEEDLVRMQDEVQQALRINPISVRANILSAELAIEQRRYKSALRAYQRMVGEHSHFIPAILDSITSCYQHLGSEPEYFDLIMTCLQQVGSTAAVVSVLDKLPILQTDAVTQPSIMRQLQMSPSIWGLQALIRFYMQDNKESKDLPVLYEIVQRIVTEHPLYCCANCGFTSKVSLWWCPGCKSWETIKPLSKLVN